MHPLCHLTCLKEVMVIYHVSVFYSNSEKKEDVLVEIRNVEDFENSRFS